MIALPLLMCLTNSFLAQAEDLTAHIQKAFWTGHGYAAYIDEKGNRAKETAFAWDMSEELSSLAASLMVDQANYQPLFDQTQKALDGYGSVFQGVYGYAVLPHQHKPDRYYDDNAWIALAQLDAYDATHESRYLELAKRTYNFVVSGHSRDLGGGIFWRETGKTSKNACINAPAMDLAARLILDTKQAVYLDTAKDLHSWIGCLIDPKDSLLYDSIDLKGRIGRTKWTYNSALMIRGDIALYKATGDAGYLSEAKKIAQSAFQRWVDGASGAIKDEGPFAHHLADAFLDLASLDDSRDWSAVGRTAIRVAASFKGSQALYGLRWDRLQVRDGRYLLLYQGSMARALWRASLEPKMSR
jgi:hypothetical protein